MFNKKEKTYRNLEIATNWWADKISGNVRHDNGALNEISSLMACALADMGTKSVTEKQLTDFKKALASEIIEMLRLYGRADLCCDYGPGKSLKDAAQKAGIPLMIFPFKTSMLINGTGDIIVRDGYGAPSKVIGRVEVWNGRKRYC